MKAKLVNSKSIVEKARKNEPILACAGGDCACQNYIADNDCACQACY